jgi:hypothetical protein
VPSDGPYPTYLANQSSSTLGQTFPAPSAGQTYAVIQIKGAQAGGLYLGFGQQLCAPAAAGTSFRFDAMVLDPSPPGTEVGLEVYGGEAVCEEALTLLSAPLTTSWTTYCVTLGQETPAITFNSAVNDPGATALILVDNIVPVSSCPEVPEDEARSRLVIDHRPYRRLQDLRQLGVTSWPRDLARPARGRLRAAA